jgi:hypothetical protein
VGKISIRKNYFGVSRRQSEDIITLEIREVSCQDLDWIELLQEGI